MSKRQPKEAWEQARIRWESDPVCSHTDIAAPLGVSRAAVQKRAANERWTRPQSLREISRKAQLQADAKVAGHSEVAGKVAGETHPVSQQASVDIRAAVLETHRADWQEHRALFKTPDMKDDVAIGRAGKVAAEVITLRQRGERAAYGLGEGGDGGDGGYEWLAVDRHEAK